MTEVDDRARERLLRDIDDAIGQFERSLYEAQVKDRLEELRSAAALAANVTQQERMILLKARQGATAGLDDDEIVALYTAALDVAQRIRAQV